MADINIKNIDEKAKNKAIFVLKCKGKSLTKAVKEMIKELEKEYDNMNK